MCFYNLLCTECSAQNFDIKQIVNKIKNIFFFSKFPISAILEQLQSATTITTKPRYKARNSMSDTNYGTGLAHLALCVTSGRAIHELGTLDESPIAFGCFAFLLGHSLLGIIRFTHPHVLHLVERAYRHSLLLAQISPLALITTQLSIDVSEPIHYAYIHAATAIFPTACEILLPEEHNEKALDLVMLGNIGSLGYLAATRERYWAMGLAVLSALNHFSCTLIAEQFEVPKIDLITYGLGFFTIFAVNCLNEK